MKTSKTHKGFWAFMFVVIALFILVAYFGSYDSNNSPSINPTPTPSCESGYVLGSDSLCHLSCGSGYCGEGATCFNNQCISCPDGTYLTTNGKCYPNSPQQPPQPEQSNLINSNPQQIDYGNANIYENYQPYFSGYCKKIDPYNLAVRQASADATRQHPGEYNIQQVMDIFDWVKSNINYLNVAVNFDDSPYSPEEILQTKSGDCKNQAVLLASMINSIGGTARVVINPKCKHAYTLVYFTDNQEDFNNLMKTISERYQYQSTGMIYRYIIQGKYWVILDTAGGYNPGDTLKECMSTGEFYTVSSCAVKTN